MPKLSISLSDLEMSALAKLSQQTLRDPRAQAKIIIHNALIEQGLLKPEYQPEHEARDASAE